MPTAASTAATPVFFFATTLGPASEKATSFENSNAFTPKKRDSAKVTTPRTSGSFHKRCLRVQLTKRRGSTTMCPAGCRTAIT